MTSDALIFTVTGMVGSSIRILLNNIYYSLWDTKTPIINGFIAVIVNVAFNLILIKYMPHKGLDLAISISAIVASLLLLLGLRKLILSVFYHQYNVVLNHCWHHQWWGLLFISFIVARTNPRFRYINGNNSFKSFGWRGSIYIYNYNIFI